MIVRWVIDTGVCYAIMRYLFPHVLLVPVTVALSAASLARCLARFRVVLDSEASQVAVTVGPWTRRVPLAKVEQVDEVLRFGTEITFRDGMAFWYSPLKKRRRVGRLLADAHRVRGHGPVHHPGRRGRPRRPPGRARRPGSLRLRHPALAARIMSGVALVLLAVTSGVHEQAGGWLVHAAAVLLRVWVGGGGVVMLLFAVGLLFRSLRGRPGAGEPGLG